MSSAGRGAVVVSGASTGIGRATALMLSSTGFEVFGGVRRKEDSQQLTDASSGGVVPVDLDVTDAAQIAALAERLEGKQLAGLVNNAGIAVTAPMEFVPIDELRRQLEVNFIGQIALTQAMLPMLRATKGRIVNVSSIGGRVALPFGGPYAASKHALEATSDSLRRELRGTGISVSVIEPGAVATPIWERGVAAADSLVEAMPERARQLYGANIERMRTVALRTGTAGIPPEGVAELIAHALTAKRPKTRYPVGRGVRMRMWLSFLLPDRLFDAMVARAIGLR